MPKPTDVPTLTGEQRVFVKRAGELLLELARTNADDTAKFVEYLDLATNLGRVRAGQAYPDLGVPHAKAVAAFHDAADAIEQHLDEPLVVEVLRVLAEREPVVTIRIYDTTHELPLSDARALVDIIQHAIRESTGADA